MGVFHLHQISMIFQLISQVYGDLKTWEDWVDLYMVVYASRGDTNVTLMESLKFEPEMHPHCFNDLVHKTTLYFQAQHSVRLPFAEAQKRVSSTVLSLIGLKPTNEVKYHRFPASSDDYMIDPTDVYFQDTDLKSMEESQNYKITNTGMQASVRMALFRKEGEFGLTKTMIDCARQQSKMWAKANNKNQNRDWHQIVHELSLDFNLNKVVIPPFIDLRLDKEDRDEATLPIWTKKVRSFVLKYLFEKEGDVIIFKQDLSQAITDSSRRKASKLIIDDADKFVDFCMLVSIADTSKKKKPPKKEVEQERTLKKEMHQDGGVYLLRPPSPQMPVLIATIFSFLASGTRQSMEAIGKMASLNGDRVSYPRYNPNVEFLETEKGFKKAVSYYVGFSFQNENTTLVPKMFRPPWLEHQCRSLVSK